VTKFSQRKLVLGYLAILKTKTGNFTAVSSANQLHFCTHFETTYDRMVSLIAY
jgi:hypothetical protein